MNYKMWHEQESTIAQGALTNSKHPKMHVMGCYPTHAVRSRGCKITGNDGEQYIDFICGLGTNLLGYGNPLIAEQVAKVLEYGISPSLPTQYEAQAVKELRTLLPMAERVKWLKSGSAACTAAIKIARAYTGRTLVLSEGYHGHEAEFTTLTSPAKGCPHSKHIEKLADQDLDSVAAVIIEPVITDYSHERKKWLYELTERCHKSGALLIFDETITAFRFKNYFVCRWLNIDPDIVICGKAIANGFPLSAVAGRKEIMDSDYFVSTTYAGDIVSLNAAIKTIQLMKTHADYKLDDLWLEGEAFLEDFNAIWPEGLIIEGYPTRGVFKGDELTKALFFQEMALGGVLFCKSWFYNHDLVKHKKEVISLCREVLSKIKRGNLKLKGEMPQNPFSMRARDGIKKA